MQKARRANVATMFRRRIEPAEIEEPTVSVYGINAPIVSETKRGIKKETNPSDEIVFESEGGELEFKFDMTPSNSILAVKISDDFITYKIKDNTLVLKASNNESISERSCMIILYNSYNQFNIISKKIIQKGKVNNEGQ